MEPLSFDSPAETDVVRRFLMSAKVFVSGSAGTQSRDLPQGQLHALVLGKGVARFIRDQ